MATNTAPNGGWWFYKWYGDMAGNMVSTTPPTPASATALDGFANLDASSGSASVLFGGVNDGTIQIIVKGFNAAPFFASTVHAVVEHTPFVNRTTAVKATDTLSTAEFAIANDQITVSVANANSTDGYRLKLSSLGGGTAGAGGGTGTGALREPAVSLEPAARCPPMPALTLVMRMGAVGEPVACQGPAAARADEPGPAGRLVRMPEPMSVMARSWAAAAGRAELRVRAAPVDSRARVVFRPRVVTQLPAALLVAPADPSPPVPAGHRAAAARAARVARDPVLEELQVVAHRARRHRHAGEQRAPRGKPAPPAARAKSERLWQGPERWASPSFC